MSQGSCKMRQHQLRPVPWLYDCELALVYGLIYGSAGSDDECRSMQHGVDIITAWLSRSSRVPPAIQVTAALATCVLLDREDPATSSNGESVLHSVFSYAVIRFVNLLVDPEQTRIMAVPVASIAADLGIPAYIVSLRHSATHEREVPPLNVLRRAVTVALEWLKDNFWKKTLPAFADNMSLVDALRLMIAGYKQKSIQLSAATADLNEREQKNRLAEEQREIMAEICDILATHNSLCLDSVHALADVLLEPGYLVPKMERSQQAFDSVTVPARRMEIWLPLFRKLAYLEVSILLDIVAKFCMELREDSTAFHPVHQNVRELDSSAKNRINCISSWANALLTLALEEMPKRAPFDTNAVLRIGNSCLLSPNKFTDPIFRLLLESGFLPQKYQAFKQQWQAVLSAPPTCQRIDSQSVNNIEHHTVENLTGKSDFMSIGESKSRAGAGVWQRVHMPCNYPIGLLPNGKVSFLGAGDSLTRCFKREKIENESTNLEEESQQAEQERADKMPPQPVPVVPHYKRRKLTIPLL